MSCEEAIEGERFFTRLGKGPNVDFKSSSGPFVVLEVMKAIHSRDSEPLLPFLPLSGVAPFLING